MTKDQKSSLFVEHERYIKMIVTHYMRQHPTYLFMYDDLLGECGLRFCTICDKFNPEQGTKFTTFLFDQLQYYMRNALTKEVQSQVAEETFVATTDFDDSYNPFKFEELLQSAALTQNQKEILRLRYILDMTYQEIADEMGVSKPAVFKTGSRALETLRRDL